MIQLHVWHMTYSHVWQTSCTHVVWLVCMRDMTHSHSGTLLTFTQSCRDRVTFTHDSFTCVTHHSFACVTYLIHKHDVTRLYVTRSYVWHYTRGTPWTFSVVEKELCHACEWVRSRIRMSHVTRMDDSCHTHEWVMSHICMSHVAHVNESCRTCEWVMSHMWMSHVAHVNESRHTYERFMSHTWMGHGTHVNESHTWLADYLGPGDIGRRRGWVMLRIRVIHVTHMNATSCHTYECDMPHTWLSRLRECGDIGNKWVVLFVRVGHVTHMNAHMNTHMNAMRHVTHQVTWVRRYWK